MLDVPAALRAVRAGTAAWSLESEQLEFKTEKPALKEAHNDLAEAAVCFANAQGGTCVVGVRDQPGGPDALVGTSLDTGVLRSRIYELTNPHLTVDASEYEHQGVRLVVLRVPEGLEVYSTASGRMQRRAGDQCLPLTASEAARLTDERRGSDWSSAPSDQRPEAINARTVAELRDLLAGSDRASVRHLAEVSVSDLLGGLGVLTDRGILTNAGAVTLAGDESSPVRIVYQFRRTAGADATFVLRARGPLLTAVRTVLEAVAVRQDTTPLNLPGGQQVAIEDYPTATVREALLNAVVHGDLRQGEPVQVDHTSAALVISSPGPLVAGVTPLNILTRGPKARFRALNDLFLTTGLVEHLGAGVKRMFREMLRSGRDAPTIEDLGDHVVVTVRGQRPDVRIARFVRGLAAGAGDDLDTLLTVRELCRRRTTSAPTLAPVVQRDVARTQEHLRSLSSPPVLLVEPTPGTVNRRMPSYRLTSSALAALGTAVEYHRRSTDDIERALVDHVRDYGWVNSGTVQRTFDVDVYRASAMLRDLVERDVLVRTSTQTRGTAVSYGPGPTFAVGRPRRST